MDKGCAIMKLTVEYMISSSPSGALRLVKDFSTGRGGRSVIVTRFKLVLTAQVVASASATTRRPSIYIREKTCCNSETDTVPL